MNFRFRKYGRAGGFLLLLLAAACQRQPPFNTVASPASQARLSVPAVAMPAPPPVEPGVSEALAQARKRLISGVAYSIGLRIPARKAELIEGTESILFYLKDNRLPVQLDFKAPTDY